MAISTESTTETKRFVDEPDAPTTQVISAAEKVYVYEAPVRIWHWVNALCIFLLCITGYFIGQPPASLSGEASFHYLFGYIRMTHFVAGQVLALFMVYRVFWAFLGNNQSRQLFVVPIWSASYWQNFFSKVWYYSLLNRKPKEYYGHNPLSQLAMLVLFVWPAFISIFTGFALYAEGEGTQSWWYSAFGWVFTLFGNSFTVHTVHRLSMWVIVWFALIHIYLSVREEIVSNASMVSTMISGWRFFKEKD